MEVLHVIIQFMQFLLARLRLQTGQHLVSDLVLPWVSVYCRALLLLQDNWVRVNLPLSRQLLLFSIGSHDHVREVESKFIVLLGILAHRVERVVQQHPVDDSS